MRVAVVRKDIKNLHLGIYPPDGRVRVAVPLVVSDAAVRVAVISKLRWIKRQRAAFERQDRESKREMVGGESHFFLGQRYRLDVVESQGPGHIVLRNRRTLELHTRPGWDTRRREQLLHRWYRERLREIIPPLVDKWQSALGVEVAAWGIKKMKTRWGSCNAEARRIWLNLELVKKPPECIEYLVVHELVHLIVRHHDDRFTALMDRHLPRWRLVRRTLNVAPLANDTWEY
ncbi:M48 family metallopeptidase [Corallococcus sp. AB018]|uniref:M48 family metallopeptidase n=1 Tax=Corallococcus sp. AB018 TaxID=2316715 RepID=UPI0018F50B8D|nr:SprT family zinc-dependent metalloprotease [Corallococcus sp. AB018]